jgi:hypothetical protein
MTMTYLQLCNRLKLETGTGGNDLTTVLNLRGDLKRLVNWVSQAYVDIQNERDDWQFLRVSTTFNTVAGKQSYSLTGGPPDMSITDFASWRNESFRAYLLSAGIPTEIILTQYYDYSVFRDFYMLGSRRLVTGRPLYWTIAPDKSIVLGFTPNDIYVVTGEYYRTPQVLENNSDQPLVPSRYQMAIVYKAMEKYGLYNVANEQIEAGRQGYKRMLNSMVFDQTPMVGMGGSLI